VTVSISVAELSKAARQLFMWSPIRSGDGNLEGKGKWNHLILNHLLLKVIQSPALFSANWINQLFTNRSELIARQKIYAHAARWPVRQDPFSSHCRSASRQIITADVSDCYAEDTFPAASVLPLNP